MRKISAIFIFFSSIFMLSRCIKPFDPQIEEMEESYLVVDGTIDMSTGKGNIILTRTQSLDVVNRIAYEAGAIVWLETEDGNKVPFIESEEGVYTSDLPGLDEEDITRLHINTTDDEAYQSDFVPVKISPEIDSISWEADDDGLKFFVNTHDPTNNTRYYRWEYIETAEYNSRFFSKYIYNSNTGIIDRRDQETQNIYLCWRNDTSKNIFLGNSSKFEEDLIIEKEIRRIAPNSWKHRFKYSIQVRQFALTKEEYEYWLTLEQSSESNGSLFDTQPSNIGGNIQSITNPERPVIGFFSIGSSTEKRAFVEYTELPITWKDKEQFIPKYCDESSVEKYSVQYYYAELTETALIIDADIPFGEITAIYTALPECIDCSLEKRGSPIKPDYW